MDGGDCLKEAIESLEEFSADNLYATILVFGGLGIAIHYQSIQTKSARGVPVVMAYGVPVSGKSTAVALAMAALGEKTSIGDK